MESWIIHRAGVINFWYYDEETFHFEEGRLLLRGANGSGKSVTMQSLVPLLFDGNKSPERLDPFGSKARRMESYLLSDGLDLEERTGYLFLEFAKPQANRYLTLGMGMRARRHAPLQTWYFLVLDNRRLGTGYDLPLYKDLGEKIPLTQKELENRLGSGNQLFTRQRDYKAAVNQHLFGYKDLSDFDELIELLIQIRSPKLSKEFKPTTMYEIMQNSLVTLTDEDLRPMSEAIENMDEIQLKIDALKASQKALGRIQHHYDKYNQHLLAAKAQRFVTALAAEETNHKTQSSLKQQLEDNSLSRQQLETDLQENQRQYQQNEQQLASLQDHDLNRLSQENSQLAAQITEKQAQQKQKVTRLEDAKTQEIQLQQRQRQQENDLYQEEKELKENLETLASLEEDTAFDEHPFFAADYEKETDEAAIDQTFQHHRQAIARYTKQVKEGLSLLQQQDQATQAYEEALAKAESATRKREQQDRHVVATEGQLNEIKEEFAESVFTWQGRLTHLSMDRTVLHQVTERAFRYGEPHRFDQVLEPARLAYEAAYSQGSEEKALLGSTLTQHQATLQEARETLEKLKSQKEPAPERSTAVTANRQRLTQQGIPHQPLYRVLDFDSTLSNKEQDSLEEALEALGLLDALVVDPQYREQVLAMDPGQSDRYLFAQAAPLSHNLSTCLIPDAQAPTPHLVQEILQSILLDPTDHRFHLDPATGLYGSGLLVGKTSRTQSSRFIGAASRRRYQQAQINAQAQLVGELAEKEQALKADLTEIEDHLLGMTAEWHGFPADENLSEAFQDLTTARRHRETLVEQETNLKETSETLYKNLKQLQAKVNQHLVRLSIAKNTQAYTTALDSMEEYRQHFDTLTRHHLQHRHLRYQLASVAQQLEENLHRQQDLRDDLFQLEKQIRQHQERCQAIEAQLSTDDFQAIHQQLTACREALKHLPKEYQQLSEDRATAKAEHQSLTEKLEALTSQQHTLTQRRRLYETAFESEWQLGYVEKTTDTPFEGSKIAQTTMAQWGWVLEEGKTQASRRESVTTALLKEQGELAEYHLQGTLLFHETPPARDDEKTFFSEEERSFLERIDLTARVQGRTIDFYKLSQWVQRQMQEQDQLLSEQDRQLFEEILIKSVSRKINAKIYHSEAWVKKIDSLMSHMDTSMGLTFHLKWVTRQAETEEQLSTRELVDLLRGDQSLLTREQKDRLIRHFRSKIRESKARSEEKGDPRGFLSLMREVLDYRKWFEFQLSYTKKGDKRKELTNNAFYTFSGGEKAMAMYVPLFSAVYAKYQGGAADCPKVISLDEAFAGVDEKNIRDMFRLLVQELELSFIANSQVLYGDYDTVPQLAIYELIRPENVTFVTTLRYRWNGHQRLLVQENEEGEQS